MTRDQTRSPCSPVSQSAFAAALLDPDRACPEGLCAWNGSDPKARLAVHRNNVVASLVDALAATFPVVQELVGAAFFRAMAGIFVRCSPPQSGVLACYGQDFPQFIAQFDPARPVPYLADVARLEAARVRAHHAADAEAVTAEAVGMAMAAGGDRIGELQAAFQPSLSTVESPHAVVSLWAAHQGVGELEAVNVGAPECAIVVRQDLDVLVLNAPAGAAAFVAAIQHGHRLGDAAAIAAGATPAFDLTATLSLLLGHGALTSLHLPRRHDS
ncbi:MAG: putative DNA-binding domain-containing protein [Rubrivivax sp.]|nr:putative DNA-binding domain-containing protein [Rubrivivax sp.]